MERSSAKNVAGCSSMYRAIAVYGLVAVLKSVKLVGELIDRLDLVARADFIQSHLTVRTVADALGVEERERTIDDLGEVIGGKEPGGLRKSRREVARRVEEVLSQRPVVDLGDRPPQHEQRSVRIVKLVPRAGDIAVGHPVLDPIEQHVQALS